MPKIHATVFFPVKIRLCLNVICCRFKKLADHSLAAWSRAMIILCSPRYLLIPFVSPVRAKNTWDILFEFLISTGQEEDFNFSPVISFGSWVIQILNIVQCQ